MFLNATQADNLRIRGTLPPTVGAIPGLQWASFWRNDIDDVSALSKCSTLVELNLRSNRLSALGDVGALTLLVDVDLSHNNIEVLPAGIGKWTKLQRLNLAENRLAALPKELGALTALTELDVSSNALTALPVELKALTALRTLNLRVNRLVQVGGAELSALASLATLDLSQNRFQTLPDLSGLKSLRSLAVAGNPIERLPEGLPRTLEDLDASRCCLAGLPQLGSLLPNLRVLHVTGNAKLMALPTGMENLQVLTAQMCDLLALPFDLGSSQNLVRLEVAANRRLAALPPSFEESSAAVLELSLCPLDNVPPEIIAEGARAIRNHLRSLRISEEEKREREQRDLADSPDIER